MHETFSQVLDRFLAGSVLELSWLRDAAIDLQEHLERIGFESFSFEVEQDKPTERMVFVFDGELKIEVLGSEIVVQSIGKALFNPTFAHVPEGVWTCAINQFVPPNFGK